MISNISILKTSSSSSILLPGEIWRIVFSFLRTGDLCRCAVTCKEWKSIVNSIDTTRWKELYLQQRKHKRWKHPFWPNDMSREPESWKELYRRRYLASRLWLKESFTPSCTSKLFFTRNKLRRKFYVGYGKPYRSIKGALDKASPYDSIYIFPGVYQDPTPLVIKFPCAIIGVDDPSKVVLTMQIEVKAESVKLENLSIKPMYPRARRRSSMCVLLKVFTGHVFIFNCNFDEGHIHIISPGVVDINSCTFNIAFINLQAVSYSSILNSEFKPDRFAIFIEEPLFQLRSKPSVVPEGVGGWVDVTNSKTFKNWYECNIKKSTRKPNVNTTLSTYTKSICSGITDSDLSGLSDNEIESKPKPKSYLSRKSLKSAGSNKDTVSDEKDQILDGQVMEVLSVTQGVIINNIRVVGGRGAIMICRMGQAWIQNSVFQECTFGVRCLQNSKIVFLKNHIHDCETTGIFMKDHSKGFIAGNKIYSNGEAGIDIRSGAAPIIQHNELYDGKRSGIVCFDSGKGLIRENDFHDNQEAAIYILHKGYPRVMNNNIWSGKAAGIAITEDGRGHISNNVITGMEWAGIDVRNGGNPVISHNLIQNGKSDGIVVGEGGKSVILDNTIDDNNGCGIWILDGSHPLIHSNHILNSGNSGIAFVTNVDHEHGSQYPDVQIPKAKPQQANNDDGDDDSSQLLLEDEFIFPLPIFEQEPASRFVHVSKPEKKIAQVEGNTIEHNHGNGIHYDGKEGIIISKNQINNNQQHGINLSHTSETIVEDNTLSNNKYSGVKIELGVNSNIQGNGIYDNGEYGVITAGVGIIKGNDIFGHQLPSIIVQSIADLSICNNRMYATKHVCIQVEENARCVIEENEFYIRKNTKEIKMHSISDVSFNSNNKIYNINDDDNDDDNDDNDESAENCDDDNIYSHKLLSEIKDWRPFKDVNNEASTAPFFTASQMNTQRSRNGITNSAFCNIL